MPIYNTTKGGVGYAPSPWGCSRFQDGKPNTPHSSKTCWDAILLASNDGTVEGEKDAADVIRKTTKKGCHLHPLIFVCNQRLLRFLSLSLRFFVFTSINPANAPKTIAMVTGTGAILNAYINTNAMVFDAIAEAEKRPATHRALSFHAQDDTEERINRCVQEIQARGIDITRSHDEWKKAGAAIAHYMGERGRDVFHAIASQYQGYSEKENNTLFSNLLNGHATRDADINSFFYLCKWYGVDISHHHTIRTPAAPLQPEKKCKVVRQDAAPIKPATTPSMTMAEEAELKRMAGHIREGEAILDGMKKENPHIAKLCDSFNLGYYGHDGWEMTEAQFDAMMMEHPIPPF